MSLFIYPALLLPQLKQNITYFRRMTRPSSTSLRMNCKCKCKTSILSSLTSHLKDIALLNKCPWTARIVSRSAEVSSYGVQPLCQNKVIVDMSNGIVTARAEVKG